MRDVGRSGIKDSTRIIADQMELAASADKCHRCGCFHETVSALTDTGIGRDTLRPVLERARSTFVQKEYDCLGCPVCWPAVAANAFSDAHPEQGAMLSCPTDVPLGRRGWPPLPGNYHVVRYRAPVAVCTLHSEELSERIARSRLEGLAIVGTMHTENLGIERLIRNVLANPYIRFLILCGEDTRQAVGHLPGQSLSALFEQGIDERHRIRGARGKRPFLKNVTREQVDVFLRQVKLLNLIGVQEERVILNHIRRCAADAPGPFQGEAVDKGTRALQALEPERWVSDQAGFFVVYPDAPRRRLIVEHFTNMGDLDCVIEGSTPAAVYSCAIERKLLSRLDHAAYLGRELALAERSIRTGEPYVQDRAPGVEQSDPVPEATSCGCAPGDPCGSETT